MNRICYKVVFQYSPNTFVSFTYLNLKDIVERNKYLLYYEIGKITKPLVGKIFVFDTIENVKKFLDGRMGFKIIKGEAINISKMKWKVCEFYSEYLNNFWENRKRHKNICNGSIVNEVPKGTLICDEFLPLEVVK